MNLPRLAVVAGVLFSLALSCKTRSHNDALVQSSVPSNFVTSAADRQALVALFQKTHRLSLATCKPTPATKNYENMAAEELPPTQVLSKLAKMLVEKKPTPKLHPEELMAIEYYTNEGTDPLNKAVLGNSDCVNAVGIVAKNLVSALNRLPPFTGTSYSMQSVSAATLANELVVGKTYTRPIFMSTSTDEAGAYFFYNAQNINVLFEVRGKSGRELAGISAFETEREVLFKPGSQFKIVEVRKEKKFEDGRSMWGKLEFTRVIVDDVSPVFQAPADPSIRYELSNQIVTFLGSEKLVEAVATYGRSKKEYPESFKGFKFDVSAAAVKVSHGSDTLTCTRTDKGNQCMLATSGLLVGENFYLPAGYHQIAPTLSLILTGEHLPPVRSGKKNVFRCDLMTSIEGLSGSVCRDLRL